MLKTCRIRCRALRVALLAALLLPGLAGAQVYFKASAAGALMAGFRKASPQSESNEVVMLLCNITNILNLSVGTTTNISVYSTNVLDYAYGSNLNNLHWSVFASFQQSSFPTAFGTFPGNTIWYTLPRTSPGTQTTPPGTLAASFTAGAESQIEGIASSAHSISSSIGGTNVYNNTNLVVEQVSLYGSIDLSQGIEDPTPGNSAEGDFNGDLPYTVENITPSSFSSPTASDLYVNCPLTYTDPLSGTTDTVCYYLGYFTFYPSGSMSFTRQANVTQPPPPPPAPTLTTTISGNTVEISFATTNGATYTLHYNNLAGLSTARSNWPALGSLVGTGATTNFTDTTTTSGRVYCVSAHN